MCRWNSASQNEKADTSVGRRSYVWKVLDHCCPADITTRLSSVWAAFELLCIISTGPCSLQALALLGWANSRNTHSHVPDSLKLSVWGEMNACAWVPTVSRGSHVVGQASVPTTRASIWQLGLDSLVPSTRVDHWKTLWCCDYRRLNTIIEDRNVLLHWTHLDIFHHRSDPVGLGGKLGGKLGTWTCFSVCMSTSLGLSLSRM